MLRVLRLTKSRSKDYLRLSEWTEFIFCKRTWGGTVGYARRIRAPDGGTTTQSEIIHSIDGVSTLLENRGVVPDHEVEITPESWGIEQNTQLDYAIRMLLSAASVPN